MALRAPLPSGTITLLFTDIEGSTQHWESRPDEMATALRRHDELLRTTFAEHGGYVFKTVGDQFCVAFSEASDAVTAAVDAQHALLREDWSEIGGLAVRMVLHSGAADERDGDYFGPTVNRAARLLAAIHGGQVVASGATAHLLNGTAPAHTRLRDLGEHRLKDLIEAEHVWQLVAPSLPDTFPPLVSLGLLPNNLPRQATPLVGRDDILREIEPLVLEQPLVTLVGSGGVGKTRVALQVAADLLDGSDQGVWFVDLAPLGDPSRVAATIAATLGISQQPERPVLETLLHYLRFKRLLVILDNCEHVIAEAARIADAILHGCAQVRMLATSREPLRISVERVYRMPSLAVPRIADIVTVDGALQYGAIALFVQRATASDARFRLTDESARIVAEICRRLDGIALAIELAAARVKVLTPRELAQKLDERFRLLADASRTALPRQQTMRALIDWSYDLLSEDEQTIFRKLSIFAGGCTLETAMSICGESDEFAMLERLSSLVEKSLLQAEPFESGTRYEMLESTRQYARERLVERGEESAVARAHASGLLKLADELHRLYETTPNRAWNARVEPELENWRAALAWALGANGDLAAGQRLAAALWIVWYLFAPAEGREYVRRAAQSVDASTDDAIVAALELAEAALDATLNQYWASYDLAKRALTRYRRLGDEGGIVFAQRRAGNALLYLDRIAEGRELLQQALESAKALGLRRTVGTILFELALARRRADDVEGARACYADALTVAQANCFDHLAAAIQMNRAELEFRGGKSALALQLACEALEIHRELHAWGNIANTLINSAAYLTALHRYDEARTAAWEGLAIARDLRHDVSFVDALQHLAAIAGLRPCEDTAQAHDDRAKAARLLGYANARLVALEAMREETEQLEYDRVLHALRDALSDDELQKLINEGSGWTEDRAVAEAMQM